jgi:hypothetical protein
MNYPIIKYCLVTFLVITFCLPATTSSAASFTFSGAELQSNPNATLHSTITSLSGTSLIFGPLNVSANQFEKLVSLPLDSLGQWSDVDGVVVTASLNLTRLSCSAVFGDNCGPEDHDVTIALGNGTQIVGSQVGEGSNGSIFLDQYTDQGPHGARTAHNLQSQNTGFPAIGSAYDVTTTFTLGASSTMVATTLLSGNSAATGNVLGRPANLTFHLMRDNGQGERYQLNSLTITSDSLTPVPVPAGLLLFTSGLLSLLLPRHRRS